MSLCEAKAIKMLDVATRRIGSYATVWGEQDCEDDRMEKRAIEPYIGKVTPMMLYLHGLHPDFGSTPVGNWDPRAFKIDETGLWVEGNVGFDAAGDRAWSRLEQAQDVGLSLGSFHYLVKREQLPDGTKAVVNWPLFEISIMEGGKQCVPSAHSAMKADMAAMVAAQMGLEVKGQRLISLLERGLNQVMEKNDWSRAEAVEASAEAAGIESGTMNEILNGEIEMPPDERLRGWAGLFEGISFEELQEARGGASESENKKKAGGFGGVQPSGLDPDKYKNLILSGRKTREVSMSGGDIDALVQERLDRIMAERAAAEQLEVDRKAELKAVVDEAVGVVQEASAGKIAEAEAKLQEVEEKNKQLDVEMNQIKVSLAAAKAAGATGPVVGMNYQADGRITIPANFLVGVSPYDRLSTFDLCVRYEVMRSYGRQPSVKFWRALAGRAVKMAREEDVVMVRNGQPVRKPALDFEALIPRGLTDIEVDDKTSALDIKSDHRLHKGGFDVSGDVVTGLGIRQIVEIAVKSDELIYSTQAGFGDEWVPTLMSAQLWRTIRLEALVLPLFMQFDMPSQPFDYPTESTDPTLYTVGEAADESQLVLTGGPFTDSKIGTDKTTFSAGKLGAISYWSEEQEEDGIIASEPQFRDQYALSFAHGLDEALISGDESTGSSNISNDGGAIGATSRFLVVDGLRHESLITTAADSRDAGALTIDDFGSTQSLMGTGGKFGVNPRDQAFILDTGVWHKAKLLSEVLTLDHFGSAATILTGQLGSLFGVPLIVSENYGLTDASGKISSTGNNNTKGSFMCINKRGIMVGWRRRPRVRVVGLPGADARYIVGSARFDIGFKEAGMVGLSYNITI
jgi:transcriptional regulator with XRE-family HTH domain